MIGLWSKTAGPAKLDMYIKTPVVRIRFHLKRNDIVAVSPVVYTETMKMIMKTQTFEYTIQSGSIWKCNGMKTERFENVSV